MKPSRAAAKQVKSLQQMVDQLDRIENKLDLLLGGSNEKPAPEEVAREVPIKKATSKKKAGD